MLYNITITRKGKVYKRYLRIGVRELKDLKLHRYVDKGDDLEFVPCIKREVINEY